MTKYREILGLHGQRISSRSIAASLHCSRHTIQAVIIRASEEEIAWPLIYSGFCYQYRNLR